MTQRQKTNLLDALFGRPSDKAIEALRRLKKGESIYDDPDVHSVREEPEPSWLQAIRGDA